MLGRYINYSIKKFVFYYRHDFAVKKNFNSSFHLHEKCTSTQLETRSQVLFVRKVLRLYCLKFYFIGRSKTFYDPANVASYIDAIIKKNKRNSKTKLTSKPKIEESKKTTSKKPKSPKSKKTGKPKRKKTLKPKRKNSKRPKKKKAIKLNSDDSEAKININFNRSLKNPSSNTPAPKNSETS